MQDDRSQYIVVVIEVDRITQLRRTALLSERQALDVNI